MPNRRPRFPAQSAPIRACATPGIPGLTGIQANTLYANGFWLLSETLIVRESG